MSHVTKSTLGKMKIQSGHENENPRVNQIKKKKTPPHLKRYIKITPKFGCDDIIFNRFKNPKPKIQNPTRACRGNENPKKNSYCHNCTVTLKLMEK